MDLSLKSACEEQLQKLGTELGERDTVVTNAMAAEEEQTETGGTADTNVAKPECPWSWEFFKNSFEVFFSLTRRID